MSVLTPFRAVSSGDMTFHYNAVQLLLCIINQVPKLVSNEWNQSFILEASILSAAYPYVSGFCKLVTIGLKVRENSEVNFVHRLFPFLICYVFQLELECRTYLPNEYFNILLLTRRCFNDFTVGNVIVNEND